MTIKRKQYWLWRAVDANGYVLDALLQSRRNKRAALRLMRKLLKSQSRAPRVMVTDKLRSYSAAKAELMPGVELRSHKVLNNRAENLHLALRRRERRMMRFKSARQCQRFVSTHGQIANLFLPHRKYLTAADHRQLTPSRTGGNSLCRMTCEIQVEETTASQTRLRRRRLPIPYRPRKSGASTTLGAFRIATLLE